MTTTTSVPDAAPAAARGFIPRFGSLLAFLPLGVWTTFHLYQNLAPLAWIDPHDGAQVQVVAGQWSSTVTAARAPLVEFLTSLVVLLPLALHTVWGFRRIRIARVNLGRYGFFENLKYVLQRASALGLLGFLVAHLWKARFEPVIRHGTHEHFSDLAFQMGHHLPTLIVYLLGVVAIAYHLANGLATGGLTWGYSATERARRQMSTLSIAFFLVLLGLGWGAVFRLRAIGSQYETQDALAAAAGDPTREGPAD